MRSCVGLPSCNHPTGDPTPSGEDIAITRRLKESGEILGIKVLDHIIVGDDEFLRSNLSGGEFEVLTILVGVKPY